MNREEEKGVRAAKRRRRIIAKRMQELRVFKRRSVKPDVLKSNKRLSQKDILREYYKNE